MTNGIPFRLRFCRDFLSKPPSGPSACRCRSLPRRKRSPLPMSPAQRKFQESSPLLRESQQRSATPATGTCADVRTKAVFFLLCLRLRGRCCRSSCRRRRFFLCVLPKIMIHDSCCASHIKYGRSVAAGTASGGQNRLPSSQNRAERNNDSCFLFILPSQNSIPSLSLIYYIIVT